MNTQTIFMCVVALLIGMLVANMLQNVCGCKKVVEGYDGESYNNIYGNRTLQEVLNIPARGAIDPGDDKAFRGPGRDSDQQCGGVFGEFPANKVDICNELKTIAGDDATDEDTYTYNNLQAYINDINVDGGVECTVDKVFKTAYQLEESGPFDSSSSAFNNWVSLCNQ